ncbi:membrane protein insertion efficiency factor YidD [Aliifodinibius halophilus]|uniref:Putative membrane protein insertion efficiency factor n=2 Tax=Fodinibius halophilus TaxID=1736908 RepID=A0A6M1TD11_9BACT|nr:membrane protein insertion efficiency factor YidD [Fodinibius halophilus]
MPALLLIRLYQYLLSGKKTTRRCRYTPSCSEYAYQAIMKFGLFKGIQLARERISRCTPDHEGGHDPVPANYDCKSKHSS